MEPLDLADVPDQALLLIDSAPIIYHLEHHPAFGPRFRPIFEAHGHRRVRLAITTLTVAEVLAGPLKTGDEPLARRYRAVFETWNLVELDIDIAVQAARLRGSLALKLPDAVQAASALAINAFGLVTNDHMFARVPALRVIS
jgi:predicted nucleic acid-binding protein